MFASACLINGFREWPLADSRLRKPGVSPFASACTNSALCFLRAEHFHQRWREVDDPAVVILRGARLQANGAGVQVHLAPLEGQDFALHPPAERVGDAYGHLEVRAEVPLHGVELRPLEEVGAGAASLSFPMNRRRRSLPFS